MPYPFIGEIRMVTFDFEPRGWAFCDGRLLQIAENTTLFELIGNTYGGDGRTTFRLPDLRGRVPIHQGQQRGFNNYYRIGEFGGMESVPLSIAHMPSHDHYATTSADSATFNLPASTEGGTLPLPTNNYVAVPVSGSRSLNAFSATSDTQMAASSVDISAETTILSSGGSQPHTNMQPYLCVNFIIALEGDFPSRY